MKRPLLLDLFCGAGGCAVGYHRAGFDVVGVDNRRQPRYPFRFVQADALEYLAEHGSEYDIIHASPPCQAHSSGARIRPDLGKRHSSQVLATVEALSATGKPWVVENVMGAPLSRFSAVLCGLMFDLGVFRHRLFESSHLLLAPEHPTHRGRKIGVGRMCCVAGDGSSGSHWRNVPRTHRRLGVWSEAMEINWMTRYELTQAIPPAYTEFIGRQLLRVLE